MKKSACSVVNASLFVSGWCNIIGRESLSKGLIQQLEWMNLMVSHNADLLQSFYETRNLGIEFYQSEFINNFVLQAQI